MDPQQLQIVLNQLAHALGMPPPPPLTPDQIASGTSLMSQLLATLGLAGNAGDSKDLAAAQKGYAKRGEKTGDAMTQFPAGEQDSSKELEQLMGTVQQMPQQFMQAFSSLLNGLSQPVNQAVQQASQITSQLTGSLGKAGQGAGLAGELPADALGDTLSAGGEALGAGGGGAGLAGSTIPAGNLGPPPTPSAGTYPASSPIPPATPPSLPDAASGARGPMGGMPMMPPGAAGGAGAGGGDSKAETKRIVSPSVKNGAPVQGRITTPQTAPEVVKRIAGKPVASRRILTPLDKRDDEDETDLNR